MPTLGTATARLIRRAGDLALTLAAAVGVLALVVVLAGVVADVRPLIVRSGSMAPDIPTGSLALTRETPHTEIEVGDVVSVPYDDTRVTHRVISIERTDTSALLRLQGDANDLPDARPHQVVSVDRVWFSVPHLGRAIAWLSRPPGVFVLAGYTAVLLLILVRRSTAGPPDRRRESPDESVDDVPDPMPRSPTAGRLSRVAAPALTLVCTTALMPPVSAAWSDAASVGTTTMETYAVPTPGATTCSVAGNAVTGFTATIEWPAARTPYAFTYTAVLRQSTTNLPVTTQGNRRRVQVTSGLLGSLLGQTVHVDIRAQVPGTAWTSQTRRVRALEVALLGADLTCGADTTG